MSRRIGVLGVPTSAGAFAPGQENAPRALRDAGLLERLHDRRLDVRDHGDRERWRWRPDRTNPRAQNLAKVVEIVGDTAGRVAEAAESGELTLVLGGDCTVGVGTVAGHSAGRQRPGVIYFDAHADLNVPARRAPARSSCRRGQGCRCSIPTRWSSWVGTRCSQRHTNAPRSSGCG